ncbi:serine/threonine-protein kinase [Streptomyces subrutilus]|uniref:serine/threonine-protein kinase n=1 Tax=Streptomyces subrutilus TaxID=36818 RepID=UPI002E122BE8
MEQLHPHDPHRIGPYRLLARLGAGGGTAQVYLARSGRGRTVALTSVRPGAAGDPRARFRREVAAARRVDGPWTAPVLDADTEAAAPWYATGYVAGPSLRRVVEGGCGPLPERCLRVLAAGLAHALRDVHRAGLVHRALTPSHVLLTLDGPRVTGFGVTGFGLPRGAGSGPAGDRPGFAAPEQERGGPVTAACDLFGLGAVLAYAATGRPPFGTAGPTVRGPEPDLDGVPAGLRELVRDCLRRDPGDRPGTAEVLARVGAAGSVADGRVLGPWLPGPLVARLGLHTVRLLDREEAGPDRPLPAAPAPPPPPPPADLPGGRGYGPPPQSPPRPRGRAASTAFLLSVALVVAVAAGATVYAVMTGEQDPAPPGGVPRPPAGPTATAAPAPGDRKN